MQRHMLGGLFFVCLAAASGAAQEPSEKSADDPEVRPPVTKADIKIVQRARRILSSPAKWNRKILALFILFSAPVALATDQVLFTIVDRVQFSVPSDWPVIASKSTAEKAVFAFKIPNAADKGTSDSTNLVIVSSYLKEAQSKDAFDKKASAPENGAKERKLVDGWRCWSFSAMQNSTEYVVWDCYRVVADCGVSVRIAWPHLPKNPSNYDNGVETVLSDFLTSVGPSKNCTTEHSWVLRV